MPIITTETLIPRSNPPAQYINSYSDDGNPGEDLESVQSSNWQSPIYQSHYLTLTLYITSYSSSVVYGFHGTASATVKYSLDGGNTFTTLRSGSNWSTVTDNVTLSVAQDLSKVVIQMISDSKSGYSDSNPGHGENSLQVTQIYTAGTLGPYFDAEGDNLNNLSEKVTSGSVLSLKDTI